MKSQYSDSPLRCHSAQINHTPAFSAVSTPHNLLTHTRTMAQPSIAAVESVFIDVTFAILMAPVDAFNAMLELFDTTEYPADDALSTKSKSKFYAADNRSLGAYWDKYTEALAMLWSRVVGFHYTVVGYLTSVWAVVEENTISFYNYIDESITSAYTDTVSPLVQTMISYIYVSAEISIALLLAALFVVFVFMRFMMTLYLCFLYPPLPLVMKGLRSQALVIFVLLCFFPLMWPLCGAISYFMVASTPGGFPF